MNGNMIGGELLRLQACSSFRDEDQARSAYKRMATGSRRMQPDRHTFRLMMGIFLQAGCLQEALQVYTDMRRVGEGKHA